MRSPTVSTTLCRLRAQAKQHPERVFTTLHHLIDQEWLLEAYRRLRKEAAAGVDGVTTKDYEADLEGNLARLRQRMQEGSYRAQPVRRVWIDKEDGKQRPLGIPALEDKILQRAVQMLLEAIYEVDFHHLSYGFRPGRSAHQALAETRERCFESQVSRILDAEVSRFFDDLSFTHLNQFLDQRVKDGVIRRLINQWLKAGILEGEQLHYASSGSPQGGVISPLLANIYLHPVLDDGYLNEVQPRLQGRSFLVRYADDGAPGNVCTR